jgi:hypothetical protein
VSVNGVQTAQQAPPLLHREDTLDRWLADPTHAINQYGAALDDHIIVSETYRQRIKRFGTEGFSFDIRFRDLDTINDISALIYRSITATLRHIQRGQPLDRVGIQVSHAALDPPILIPFRPLSDVTPSSILRFIEEVAQSNQQFELDEGLTIKVTHVRAPAGTSRKGQFKGNWDEQYDRLGKGHGSRFIRIVNTDNLCLARAVVTAIAHFKHIDDRASVELRRRFEEMKKGDRDRRTAQRTEARRLMERAGLTDHQGACGIPELEAMQAVEPLYRIRVFSRDALDTIVYEGRPIGRPINLYHHDNHFDVITSVPAFVDSSYFCDYCNKGYSRRDQHTTCGHRCRCCYKIDPCEFVEWLCCDQCRRWFVSQACLVSHTNEEVQGSSKVRSTICRLVKRCSDCGITLHSMKREEHECGRRKCSICKEHVDVATHQCYMQQIEDQQQQLGVTIVFDFECTQELPVDGNSFKHQVNCCVAWRSCGKCTNDPCCKREWFGADTLQNFCKWLFRRENK